MSTQVFKVMGIAAALAWPAALHAATTTQVYPVPAGARPHDVAPAPDGKVWYTAQRQGALGILDPETGEVRQVPLGEGSAPHGVIQGPDGAAWITDGGSTRSSASTRRPRRWTPGICRPIPAPRT